MESPQRVLAAEMSIDGILARAEQTVALAGERLLVERLHRVLNEGGSAALTSFSATLLPDLQEIVALLPCLLHEEVDPTAIEMVRRLGATLQERGVSLNDIVNEGIDLHDRLLGEVAQHLREHDRALVTAMSQLSRTLLKVGQGALLAYYDSATSLLAQLANSDSLTGLANRRYFDARFGEELLRAQRTQKPLALILVDVDDLKLLNDTFGHASGDELLIAIASVLRGHTRGIDVAARIGGDEFALLLPETDHAGAEALLERLRHGLGEQQIQNHLPRFSAGVAVYPDDGKSSPEMMEHADSLLYQMKRGTPTPFPRAAEG